MTQEIVFRKNIAVGQKSNSQDGAFGQGFNYLVEVGFSLEPDVQRETYLKAIDEVLSQLDHKALGVDVKLAVEPSSVGLCQYIAEKIKERTGDSLVSVKMIRGDGFQVLFYVYMASN